MHTTRQYVITSNVREPPQSPRTYARVCGKLHHRRRRQLFIPLRVIDDAVSFLWRRAIFFLPFICRLCSVNPWVVSLAIVCVIRVRLTLPRLVFARRYWHRRGCSANVYRVHWTLTRCLRCGVKFERFIFSGGSCSRDHSRERFRQFIDDQGLIRVGGHLSRPELPESKKHQLLLAKTSRFSLLLIRQWHDIIGNWGPQILSIFISRQYWILSICTLIRLVISRCTKCVPPYLCQFATNCGGLTRV